MKQQATLIRARLKTPRAAAIAGSLFAVLLITGLVLFRLSVRADPLETGAWLKQSFFRTLSWPCFCPLKPRSIG
jgi:hypothetical protein